MLPRRQAGSQGWTAKASFLISLHSGAALDCSHPGLRFPTYFDTPSTALPLHRVSGVTVQALLQTPGGEPKSMQGQGDSSVFQTILIPSQLHLELRLASKTRRMDR